MADKQMAPSEITLFDRGAIAFVDALGFKGIWGDSRRPNTAALTTLENIRRRTDEFISDLRPVLVSKAFPKGIAGLFRKPAMRVVQLSDTIVVAAWRSVRKRMPWKRHELEAEKKFGMSLAERELALDAYLRLIVAGCVCEIQRTAAQASCPLVYRGVITTDLFAVHENVFLGPAVDYAAEVMAVPDGAFVWIAPEAAALNQKWHLSGEPPWDAALWNRLRVNYNMPLKSGRFIKVDAINPFATCLEPKERAAVVKGMIRAMAGSALDVVIKRQNTRIL